MHNSTGQVGLIHGGCTLHFARLYIISIAVSLYLLPEFVYACYALPQLCILFCVASFLRCTDMTLLQLSLSLLIIFAVNNLLLHEKVILPQMKRSNNGLRRLFLASRKAAQSGRG